MTIQSDRWIREQARKGMIEPFTDGLEREGVISYGLSSFGYDLRAAPEWRIFVNAFNTVVDPKNFNTDSLVEVKGDTCIIPPNSRSEEHTSELQSRGHLVCSLLLEKK